MCWVEPLERWGTDAVHTLVPTPSPSCPIPALLLLPPRPREAVVRALMRAVAACPCCLGRCHCRCRCHRRPDQTDGPGGSLTEEVRPSRRASSPLALPLLLQNPPRPPPGCLETPGCLSGRGATAVTRAVLVALEQLSSPAWKPIFIAARPCGVASAWLAQPRPTRTWT